MLFGEVVSMKRVGGDMLSIARELESLRTNNNNNRDYYINGSKDAKPNTDAGAFIPVTKNLKIAKLDNLVTQFSSGLVDNLSTDFSTALRMEYGSGEGNERAMWKDIKGLLMNVASHSLIFAGRLNSKGEVSYTEEDSTKQIDFLRLIYDDHVSKIGDKLGLKIMDRPKANDNRDMVNILSSFVHQFHSKISGILDKEYNVFKTTIDYFNDTEFDMKRLEEGDYAKSVRDIVNRAGGSYVSLPVQMKVMQQLLTENVKGSTFDNLPIFDQYRNLDVVTKKLIVDKFGLADSLVKMITHEWAIVMDNLKRLDEQLDIYNSFSLSFQQTGNLMQKFKKSSISLEADITSQLGSDVSKQSLAKYIWAKRKEGSTYTEGYDSVLKVLEMLDINISDTVSTPISIKNFVDTETNSLAFNRLSEDLLIKDVGRNKFLVDAKNTPITVSKFVSDMRKSLQREGITNFDISTMKEVYTDLLNLFIPSSKQIVSLYTAGFDPTTFDTVRRFVSESSGKLPVIKLNEEIYPELTNKTISSTLSRSQFPFDERMSKFADNLKRPRC